MIRAVVVDDEPVTSEGIALLLRKAGIDVLTIAQTPQAAVALVGHLGPDLVVCDVMFAGTPVGLELPSLLRAAGLGNVPVLHLSTWDMPYLVERARKEGSKGYALKGHGPKALLQAIERVVAGGDAFPPRANERSPTDREIEVIVLVAAGLGDRDIGERLVIQPKSVGAHLGRLYGRYGVSDRTRLATLALARGWITAADIDAVSREPVS